MNNKYEEYIMEDVRQNLGLEADDTSRDEEINEMDRHEVLDRVLTWQGLISFGGTIRDLVEEIYNVELLGCE